MSEYKFIPGYEGLYDMDKYGNIRSYYTFKGEVCAEPQRYMFHCRKYSKTRRSPTVCLYKNKKCKEFRIIDLYVNTFSN